MITYEDTREYGAKMRIVGIGGGGCNAINSMIASSLTGVEFIAINTDIQALEANKAHHKVQIGKNLTRGLGAGADPTTGRRAAEEDIDSIKAILDGSDLVFVTCGMGGGTGTGAAPIVAQVAKSLGALTIGIVTKPFSFERAKRMNNAMKGIEDLRGNVDTLIVIPNDKILVTPKNMPFIQAFRNADDVLYRATKGIADLISNTGYVNVDFADVKKIMTGAGDAIMGIGVGSGENRSEEAVKQAINSPLLEETTIQNATGVLLNIRCPEDFTTEEMDRITSMITGIAGDDAEVIWGFCHDPNLKNEVHVSVIAAGLNRTNYTQPSVNSSPKESANQTLTISAKKSANVYWDKIKDLKSGTYNNLDKPAILRNENEEETSEQEDLLATGTDSLEEQNIPALLRTLQKMKKQ